jgi:endonuclease-3
MQYLLTHELSASLSRIDHRLRASYGSLPECEQLDPVSQLVLSLIGARTKGDVSLGVFRVLRKHFQNWSAVLELSEMDLTFWLNGVTYPERKAAQLLEALRMINARSGSLCLEFLRGWPVGDAQAWLRKLPGVGPKVSAAVLNFSTLRKRVLVVDCHHFRVMRRLELLRVNTPFSATQRVLMDQHIPNDWTADDLDDHHRFIKLHGQSLCFHKGPLCRRCPLQDICPTGRRGVYLGDTYDIPDESHGSDERFMKGQLDG